MEPLREAFRVRTYEVDTRRRLTLRALCAYLQEAAGLHAAQLGASMERLAESGLAWVLHRMKVEVARWPLQGERVEVATWPSRFDRVLADREFELEVAGRRVAAATTRWAVADLAARRPVRLPAFITALPVDGRSSGVSLGRGELPAVERAHVACAFPVRRSDLDVVGHVNNTQYVGWVEETVPEAALASLRPAEVEIVFRQEALHGDVVLSQAAPLAGAEATVFAHVLRRQEDGSELARALTRWTP